MNTSQAEIEISDERQLSCDTNRNLNQVENYNIKFLRNNLLEESRGATKKPEDEDSDEFNIDL